MEPPRILCKRLIYQSPDAQRPTVLLGLLVSDIDGILTFQTARRTYQISRKLLIELSDTSEPFMKAAQQAQGVTV